MYKLFILITNDLTFGGYQSNADYRIGDLLLRLILKVK